MTIEPYAFADALAEPDLASRHDDRERHLGGVGRGEQQMSPAAYTDLERQAMPSDVHERRLAGDGQGRVVGMALDRVAHGRSPPWGPAWRG